MKKKQFIVMLIVTVHGSSAFFPCTTAGQSKLSPITLINPSTYTRADEPVVIDRSTLSKLTGNVPSGKIPRLQTASGEDVPSQTDDLNGDGQWDELAFLYAFKAREKATLRITFVEPDQLPPYTPRAHARLGRSVNRDGKFVTVKQETMPPDHRPQETPWPYQFEGPGWESDKVAFRIYLDRRNGKDIFGKTTTEMVIDRVGLQEDYHTKQAWGMDVLKVGNSLGAGSLALQTTAPDGTTHLARLGEQTATTHYELVADGPVRAIIRLRYEGWQVAGTTYTLVDEITIWGGKYGYQGKATLSGFSGERTLLAGIVNLHSEKSLEHKHNLGYSSLATHAKQSENRDYLSMGILVKNDELAGFGEAPETGDGITQTYYVQLKARPEKPVTYWFFAGWEGLDARFSDENNFINLLQSEADRLQQPIRIEGIKKGMK